MTSPNATQQALIDGTEGCYLVDAGPGTGKTFTITRRYARIIEQNGVSPDDVLLLTFTRNAATEMRDRIVRASPYESQALRDAPIQTFHALCHDILDAYGEQAPRHLGIDATIGSSTRVLEDRTLEADYFRTFLQKFTAAHPEHADILRIVKEPGALLDLISQLAAKGIVPTRDGWYRNSKEMLLGDRETFDEIFVARNQPRNNGNAQSKIREDLNQYETDACYRRDAPRKEDIRGDGTKVVPSDVRELAFEEDRRDVLAFLHDVYIAYLEFVLSQNYLNFGFLQLFAFVHLCEADQVRERLQFEYVMIDEFQDTSEIQFKLALLLAGSENLCVVGDWKQSIYSFQYAAVENITAFRNRLQTFRTALNVDRVRVQPSFDTVNDVELERNYRSTHPIVSYAEDALVVPATGQEEVDDDDVKERVVSLTAETAQEHSRIEAIQHPEEYAAVLTKITEIVGNDEYAVRTEDDTLRPPTFDDIAVMTRTRDFGRELLSVGREHGFPMAYEGGVEVFRSDAGKLVLAWLRILEDGSDADRGWAVVLEQAGYRLDEMKQSLSDETYPADLRAFRNALNAMETVSGVVQKVVKQYGLTGPVADVLRTTLQDVIDTTTKTRSDLIRYIERGISQGTTREITIPAGADAVTVQTIHASKGLEYPIVLLANMNRRKFPTTSGGNGTLVYDEQVGLRQTKIYANDHGEPYLYDSWRWDILKACRPNTYSEERRLLYVAMTRARDHLIFSAGETPNTFLKELPVTIETYPPAVEAPELDTPDQKQFEPSIVTRAGTRSMSAHDLMDDSVFEEGATGRGLAFGSRVHSFAEAYALGRSVTPHTDQHNDEANVQAFLDSLEGDCLVEQHVTLPLQIGSEQIVVRGYADLLHITPTSVDIIDYKTDESRHAESEYRKQLSVYYHVVDAIYPDRDIRAAIYYTQEGEREQVQPLSRSRLQDIVQAMVTEHSAADS